MSSPLIARSPDLKRLRDEGYDIQVVADAYLVVRDIPYVTPRKTVEHGILVCPLTLANDIALEPPHHTAHFAGEHPCHADGRPMTEIVNKPQTMKVNCEITTNFYLSAKPKPADKYTDFYQKVTTYVRRISDPVRDLGSDATAKTFALIRADEEDPIFNYLDSAASRAGISEVKAKLRQNRVAILGLGGTGAYVLDFVAKTPVREIHLFDGKRFLQHNAFRMPGAASGEEIERQLYKVNHYQQVYSKLRKGIIAHPEFVTESNIDSLEGMDFVFMCMEAGPVKRAVIEKLLALKIPFVETGMGVQLKNNALTGLVRVTAATEQKSDHIWDRIPMSDGGVVNEYDKNIQIGELNALNAALAVIKWKKIYGFYADLSHEHNSVYAISRNNLNNEDTHS